ncbi:MAG: HDOD domain-containing protein [Planctomycetota bacterium]
MSDSQALRKLLKSNLTIPTMPAIVQKISALIRDPKTGTREIGALVAEDAPLAAKVLRIANSAYYGLQNECLSTEHASTILGLNVLKNIVTQVSVISQFDNLEQETGFSVSSIWKRASLTAQIAERMAPLATKVRVLSPDEFYVCGLLHKVGQVVMLDGLGKPYAQLLQVASYNPGCTQLLETKKLGFNHQDVGALVASVGTCPKPSRTRSNCTTNPSKPWARACTCT